MAFHHLTDKFALGKHCRMFHGPVVASEDAIIALVHVDGAHVMIHSDQRAPVARVMDLTTGLVDAALPLPGLENFEMPLNSVAGMIGADFPVPMEGERAFVFPRQNLSGMRMGALAGGLVFFADQLQVTLYISSSRREAAAPFLRAHGYEVDTRSLWQRWFSKKAG
ncbi:MAG: hypothetical protein CMJ18_26975 [Phycisphaeraceae bacterium]|nr:hypothetical protein [Phycisphaeraceae bacterium]